MECQNSDCVLSLARDICPKYAGSLKYFSWFGNLVHCFLVNGLPVHFECATIFYFLYVGGVKPSAKHISALISRFVSPFAVFTFIQGRERERVEKWFFSFFLSFFSIFFYLSIFLNSLHWTYFFDTRINSNVIKTHKIPFHHRVCSTSFESEAGWSRQRPTYFPSTLFIYLFTIYWKTSIFQSCTST